MKVTALLFVLASLWTGFAFAQAQDSPISEDQFWARLQQSQRLLDDAGGATALEVITLWQGVTQVQGGDRVTPVEMGWLTEPLRSDDAETLKAVQEQIAALLAYHEQQEAGTSNSSSPSQAALDDVLRDPRFQYAEVTPTPLPPLPPTPDLPDLSAPDLSLGLSQFLLTVVGIVVVVFVLLYFARTLGIQGAALPGEGEDDEPATASGARDRASERAAAQDYRTAIRYLYLSCLLMLSERGLIHYDATLTNREHLRQVQAQPQLLKLLRPVVNAFEEVWYGYAPVDEAFYQQFLRHIEQLREFVP